jgi:hypothetical protein
MESSTDYKLPGFTATIGRMEVLVDAYFGKAEDDDGSWIFSGHPIGVPTVRVTFKFSDENDAKRMKASLLKGEVTTCGVVEQFIEEIEIEAED